MYKVSRPGSNVLSIKEGVLFVISLVGFRKSYKIVRKVLRYAAICVGYCRCSLTLQAFGYS